MKKLTLEITERGLKELAWRLTCPDATAPLPPLEAVALCLYSGADGPRSERDKMLATLGLEAVLTPAGACVGVRRIDGAGSVPAARRSEDFSM